jgi:hypothetical protein
MSVEPPGPRPPGATPPRLRSLLCLRCAAHAAAQRRGLGLRAGHGAAAGAGGSAAGHQPSASASG